MGEPKFYYTSTKLQYTQYSVRDSISVANLNVLKTPSTTNQENQVTPLNN
jgi:hypothetical protein